jgi:bacteriorhodopsin
MKNTSAVILSIFLIAVVTNVEAKIGLGVGKAGLVNSPNWFLIIIFTIGAIFMLSIIKEVFKDYENVKEKEEKNQGNFMKAFSILGFLLCIYIVFVFAIG